MKKIITLAICSLLSLGSFANTQHSFEQNAANLNVENIKNVEFFYILAPYASFHYLQEYHCKNNRYKKDSLYKKSKKDMERILKSSSGKEKEEMEELLDGLMKDFKEQYANENIGNDKRSCQKTYKEIESIVTQLLNYK